MKLFSDELFFQYVMCMLIFISVSRPLLNACSWSFEEQNWVCSIFMITSYALLMYICSMSIKETENSKDEEVKLTRYFINSIIIWIRKRLTTLRNINLSNIIK